MEKRREKGLTFDTDSQWEKVKRKKSVTDSRWKQSLARYSMRLKKVIGSSLIQKVEVEKSTLQTNLIGSYRKLKKHSKLWDKEVCLFV